MSAEYHAPVLRDEVVSLLQPRGGGSYVDGTVGGGGHAIDILRASEPDGRLIGIDRDEEAIGQARQRLRAYGGRVQLVHANLAEIEGVVRRLGMTAVNGILFDLGASSRQFDEATRGFSFRRPGPLDMRMDRQQSTTAAMILARTGFEELATLFRRYGEERRARSIAREIVRQREGGVVFETTTQLARLVEQVAGPVAGRSRIHPATRVFQALRVAVNDELDSLRRGLAGAVAVLARGGRLAVISFHSLEDRIVKQFFRDQSRGCVCPPGLPACACGCREMVRVITRRPLTAGADELARNPRSRSAKLRVAERI